MTAFYAGDERVQFVGADHAGHGTTEVQGRTRWREADLFILKDPDLYILQQSGKSLIEGETPFHSLRFYASPQEIMRRAIERRGPFAGQLHPSVYAALDDASDKYDDLADVLNAYDDLHNPAAATA